MGVVALTDMSNRSLAIWSFPFGLFMLGWTYVLYRDRTRRRGLNSPADRARTWAAVALVIVGAVAVMIQGARSV